MSGDSVFIRYVFDREIPISYDERLAELCAERDKRDEAAKTGEKNKGEHSHWSRERVLVRTEVNGSHVSFAHLEQGRRLLRRGGELLSVQPEMRVLADTMFGLNDPKERGRIYIPHADNAQHLILLTLKDQLMRGEMSLRHAHDFVSFMTPIWCNEYPEVRAIVALWDPVFLRPEKPAPAKKKRAKKKAPRKQPQKKQHTAKSLPGPTRVYRRYATGNLER